MTHKHLLILAFTAAGSLACGAIDTSYYADHSVLSSGRWVKISVAESGMQQITPAQLSEWGFTDPSAVTVYGYGGVYSYTDRLDAEAPDDLCQQPTLTTDDGRILFYGEANARPNFVYWALRPDTPVPGVDRNPAASEGYYYLTDSQERLEAVPIAFAPADGAIASTNHLSVGYYEDEVSVPSYAGHNYFGRDIVSNGGISTTFPLYDRFTTGNIYGNSVVLRIVAGARSSNNPALKATFTSGTETTSRTLILDKAASETIYYTTTYNNATAGYMSATVNSGVSRFYFGLDLNQATDLVTWGALDYLAYFYPRVNRLGTKSELLICSNSETSGALKSVVNAANVCTVWDVSLPHRVRPYETAYDADNFTLSFSIGESMKVGESTYASRSMAFNPNYSHRSVRYVGEVVNQNLHALDTPDFLIVTNSVCGPQAERLAEIHRLYLGQKVLVVDIDDIYNEFSSGSPCPWAVRRFAKMLYDRDPAKLRHILMFGGSSFDPRGLDHAATTNYLKEGTLLPAYAIRDYQLAGTKTGSYSSDAYFGILEDSAHGLDMHMRKMNVNVGRLNAMNIAEATAAVDKVFSYLTEPPTTDVTNHVIACADAGDRNSHMDNAESVDSVFRSQAPGITVTKGYVSLYYMDTNDRLARDLQDAVTRNLRLGVGYYTYSGHGSEDVFSAYKVWDNTLVRNTEYNFYPVAMLATCDSYGFDRLEDCISTAMVFQPKGGMIGVIGAGRSVYQARNQLLNTLVSQLYAEADSHSFLGDLLRESRNILIDQYPAESGLHVNTSCYNLCGDPAIPLYTADTRIVTDKINGTSAADSAEDGSISITPLGRNTVSGYIATEKGSTTVDANFNGKIIMTLYESPVDRQTYSRSIVTTGENTVDITMDEDVLAQYTGQVVNGRFDFDFVAPATTREGSYNRMTFVAYCDNDGGLFPVMARGASFAAHMALDDIPGESADTTPPVITAMYIDSPEFANGDVVGSDFTLYATIEPDAGGLHTVSQGVGSDSYLIFDGKTKTSISRGMYLDTDADGLTTLTFPVKSLTDGRHDYELVVHDTSGNAARRSISFIVCNSNASASLSVEEHPARTSATFNLEHNNFYTNAPSGRLIVEDALGNTVFSGNVEFPYTWDLSDSSGKRVGDGLYQVYATVKGGTRYANTEAIPLVVLE